MVHPPGRRGTWEGIGSGVQEGGKLSRARLYPVLEEPQLPRGTIRLDPWEAEYLFMIASLSRLGMVEIGRFRGGSTFLLACASCGPPVWSIDISPVQDAQLLEFLATHRIGTSVHLLVGDSSRGTFPEIGEYDVLFVDGDHSYEGCLADLRTFFPRLAPGGHVLVHDCYAGREVQTAVIDFVAETPLDVIRSPQIPAAHWNTDYGSIAHLRKPLGEASSA